MALESSYTSRSAGSPGAGGSAPATDEGKYWSLSKKKQCYLDFLHSKREELDEQIDARRYYHGSQYTDEQLKTLQRRKQPIMTYNRISKKVNAIVGQLERLKQDPKAYARTPQHEEGADLATAVLRFVLDENEWNSIAPYVAHCGAVDGIGGIEMDLVKGDKGDPDIDFKDVDVQAFFYDPRSYRPDFSDARYMGIGKWMDEDEAKNLYPDVDFAMDGGGDELTSNSDRENRWFSTFGVVKRVRVVEIWYRHKGKWCWGVFTGGQTLAEGPSPFVDEDGKPACKYIMFSGNVDHDGDRYGFVRNLKSPQDGINARQSKMQHILASKRIIVSQGAVQDIEKTRAEWARPDGVIVTNGPVNDGAKPDDQSFDFAGWSKMYEQSVAEIEQYGVNSAGLVEGEQGKSGRAIALLQQAGIAELGPYILAYRGWKVRVYRAIWNAVQKHWQAERYVRVTDDEGLAQYLAVNQMQLDPMTGMPTIVNAIGSLDVDIILDEGPDTINAMQDVYEALQQVVPAIAPLLAPQQAGILVDMLVNSSPIDATSKKRWREASELMAQQGPPPDPEVQKAQMMAELKAQEQQQMMQLKQAETANNIEMKRAELAVELEMQQQRNAMEMQNAAAKNEMEMGNETVRNQADMENQRQRNEMDIEFNRQKNEAAIATEQDKTAAKTGAPTTANIKAFEEIAEGFKQGMALIAEAMTQPKKITVQRNEQGKVTGATAS